MKTRLVVTAAALAAGFGAAGAKALDVSGSDTLFELTRELVSNCAAAAGINYVGGGSSVGENATVAGTQQVAPMSRFLNATGCGAGNTGQSLAIGLDGVGVFKDNSLGSDCGALRFSGSFTVSDFNDKAVVGYGNGVAGPDDGTGAAVAGSYSFTSWAEVLRIVYTGQTSPIPDSCSTNPPSATALTAKRCNSDIRHSLVENWGNIFTTANGSGGPGCSDAKCTKLKHAFRRDDFSGTTDVFLQLIGSPSIGTSFNVRTFCNGLELEDLDPVRRSCTTAATPANDPEQVCAPIPYKNRNAPFGTDGSPSGAQGACNTSVEPPSGANCPTPPAAGEVGDLGLVLAMSIPALDYSATPPEAIPAAVSGTDDRALTRYHEQSCALTGGSFNYADIRPSLRQFCPNGNGPVLGGKCLFPVRNTTNGQRWNCLANRNNKPTVNRWTNFDARSFNLTPHSRATGKLPNNVTVAPGSSNTTAVNDPRWGFGGHYRIHQTKRMPEQTSAAAGNQFCREVDATEQIGCLVVQSPCSIGYAGLEARDDAATGASGANLALELRAPGGAANGAGGDVGPNPADIGKVVSSVQADLCTRYPLSRILYVGANKGFGGGADPYTANFPNITGAENGLLQCAADKPGLTDVNGADTLSALDSLVSKHGFIPITPYIAASRQRVRICPTPGTFLP